MKRSISMILVLVLLFGMLPMAVFAADLPMVTLSVDKTSVKKGETVTLSMILDGDVADSVYGWQWNFIWDCTYFEVASAEVGDAAQSMVPGVPSMEINPIINTNAHDEHLPGSFTQATVTQGNTLLPHYLKAGTIATLTLTAKTDIPTDVVTKFYLDYVIVMDTTGMELNVVTTDARYEWGGDYKVVPGDDIGYVVKVNETVPVSAITLDKTAMTLILGQSDTIVAAVDPETATDKTVTWDSSDETVATVADGVVTAVGAGVATITAQAGGKEAACIVTVFSDAPAYTVTMGEDKSIVAGETVMVPVVVGHTTDVATYNAFDMRFSYDAAILELTSVEIEGLTVTTDEGTVRVQGYGADRAVGSTPFSLTFKAVGAGTANVTVTSAKVDISANAIDKNAPDAALLDADTAVAVSGYPVTLPDTFEGETVTPPNQEYTFSVPVDYYDYTVAVTIGGKVVEGVIDNGDGTYTIPAELVTGEIVVTTTKTGKIFGVTLGTDMTGNPTAQYMTDYQGTLTAAEGFTYEVSVTIGGDPYTGYSVAEGVYTIPGADITGEIIFSVVKTEIPKAEFSVTFEGSGAGDAAGEGTVIEGSDYTFTLNKAEGYTYAVTAVMGENKKAVDVKEADGKYTIAKVSGNLIITIEKTANLTVEVSEYVQLDGRTIFLVTADGPVEEGKAYAYDGSAMYYSEVYEAWCCLVIVEEGATLDGEYAKTMVAATETSYITLTATSDVNMSGLVDINDAQLVYDIYNARYDDFTVVVMQKFLNADVNGDKVVNVTDAAAVVAAIQ